MDPLPCFLGVLFLYGNRLAPLFLLPARLRGPAASLLKAHFGRYDGNASDLPFGNASKKDGAPV